MSQKLDPIFGVPTNIITGFLGVGKTSAILHLLKNKPKDERWAVLVNEFGEIGIDGSILEGQHTEQQGVYIREVPGGCMCCTAGLPMQVALSQLLRLAKPDRLLIEPTGLGHPKEVLQTLNDGNFRGVLAIHNIVTLVDARHLSDSRYIEHDTYQQQVDIADLIVANKQDLYSDDDKSTLKTYIKQRSLSNKELVFTEQGKINHALLDGPKTIAANGTGDALTASSADNQSHNQSHTHDPNSSNLNSELPECGYIKALNRGEGFESVGWRFSSRFNFDQTKLFIFLSGVSAERLKATFITSSGCIGYNLTKDALTEIPLEYLDESRIEIIASELNDSWEKYLLDCLSSGNLEVETA